MAKQAPLKVAALAMMLSPAGPLAWLLGGRHDRAHCVQMCGRGCPALQAIPVYTHAPWR